MTRTLSAPMFAVILAISLVIASPAAHAAFWTGQQLLALCTGAAQAQCLGYIQGIADAQNLIDTQSIRGPDGRMQQRARSERHNCMPDGTTSQQLLNLVVAYLRNRPQERPWPAAAVTLNAIGAADPCR
jgi:hypothetical protein